MLSQSLRHPFWVFCDVSLLSRTTCRYDAWCLPQGKERTEDELADFRRMLKEVNLLYLGTSVLILLDLSYISRFWVRPRK